MIIGNSHTLHQSDFYRITDFECHCDVCSVSDQEYNDSMCISFIRKGFFEYQTFRRKDEVHTGRILVSKPGYEHTTRHIDGQPDTTTVLEFTSDFFKTVQAEYNEANWFLRNNDIHSILLQSNPDLDYMHDRIWKLIRNNADNMQLDELTIEILNAVIKILTHSAPVPVITDSLRKYHLVTVERAKQYIFENFSKNISLRELSQYCLVSTFHFSRIFKAIMNVSPHQYLTAIRMNHAKLLLTTGDDSINDIAFVCGFNSAEHFATSYKQHFKINPSLQRQQP